MPCNTTKIFQRTDVCLENSGAIIATKLGRVVMHGKDISNSVKIVKQMQIPIFSTFLSFKEALEI